MQLILPERYVDLLEGAEKTEKEISRELGERMR